MNWVSPGKHKSVEAFQETLRRIHPDFDCDLTLEGQNGVLGRPLKIGARTIGNRFCIHPMEGWDGTHDGLPSPHTLRRWRRFGESGAKFIWGCEAYAVEPGGRANPNQLFFNKKADPEKSLSRLLSCLRGAHQEKEGSTSGLVVGLQLTHSGRFSRPEDKLAPLLVQHHPILDQKYGVSPDQPTLTDLELSAIGENYVRAAKAAWNAGFDFVDVKCCHGYLLHELLSARHRKGNYGGTFLNRTRLVREIIEAIRTSCPGLEIGVRASILDVFPYSPNQDTRVGEAVGWEDHIPYLFGFGTSPDRPLTFDWEEPLLFLRLLSDLQINLINVTLGSPYATPHLQRPAAYPPSDGYLPPTDPLLSVLAHIQATRKCKEAFPDMIFVGSGYSYLQDYLPHVAQHEVRLGHVDFVGLGRMALIYPDLPRDVLFGKPLQRRKICRTFSDCTTAPRHGFISGCYPLDEYYRRLPEAQTLKKIKAAP